MAQYERVALEKLCSIKAGLPIGRAKRFVDSIEPRQTRVLVPRAMEGGGIIDDQLAVEYVYEAKDEFFTREGDVVLKLSTPYDAAYIDEKHTGILVTSFSVILRANSNVVDMRYLAAFLNQPHTLTDLQQNIQGSAAPVIKKKDFAGLMVAVPPYSVQERLAALQKNVQDRKDLCRRMSLKSEELLQAEFAHEIWPE